ncbi:hypothetical protein RYX36_021945 [Vicia faba]
MGRTLLHHTIICNNERALNVLLNNGVDTELALQTTEEETNLYLIHMALQSLRFSQCLKNCIAFDLAEYDEYLFLAVCLDGTLPAYHFDRRYGSGANSWIVNLEGGAWCNNVRTCVYRKTTRRGSSNFMEKAIPFTGIMSNNPRENPDFFNWNRVKIRYCNGASFTGDSENRVIPGNLILNMLLHHLSPNSFHMGRTLLHHTIICNNERALNVECTSE